MAAVVTRSPSPISVHEWEELNIPASYRAEIIQSELVVYPLPHWQESGEAPPISVRDWEEVTVPESYRAEIVQSELIVSPAPSFEHCVVQSELFLVLAAVLPAELRVLAVAEWRFEQRGRVAMAPQPDLVVVRRDARAVDRPPVLGVEVLSPTDRNRFEAVSHLTRIEGKRLDYATHGLADYLEVDMASGRPVVTRFELHDGVLVEVERAEGDKPMVVDRPFSYELVPEKLLAR